MTEDRRDLLNVLSIPESRQFVPDLSAAGEAEVAAGYEQTIAAFFGASPSGPCPSFDLILLGIGEDGHTASLFPGMPSLNETRRWVVSTPPGTLPPPIDRITFTYPLINAARQVVFIASGTGKAAVLHELLDCNPSPLDKPAAGVKPASGNLLWLIDKPASRLLTPGVY